MSHTPGPWKYVRADKGFALIGSTGARNDRYDPMLGSVALNHEADARLIVAVPELLAALTAALPVLEHARDGDRTPFFACEMILSQAKAAIAKATEET